MMDQNMDKYIKSYIETRNYIPFFKEQNGDYLYLKDYSKVVRGIPGSISIIPERFEEENITLLVTPTEQEKVILATSLSDVNPICLGAIINGRKMLETLSKEEAIKECDKINKKFLEDHLLSKDTYAADKELNKMTRAYLDNTLYEKSLQALNEFASIEAQKVAEINQQLEETTEEKQVGESGYENTLKENAQQREESKISDIPVSSFTADQAPKTEETADSSTILQGPSIEIPSVDTSVMQTSLVDNSSIEAYNQMVAEVVQGNSQNSVAPTAQAINIAELLQPQTVSIVPPSAPVKPETPDLISTPPSLEERAPSFEGEIAGRTI